MARAKKNDLVKLADNPCYYDGSVLDWNVGVILRGPYEESVVVSEIRNKYPVNFISLVCDVLADGKVYRAIPLELLVRQ